MVNKINLSALNIPLAANLKKRRNSFVVSSWTETDSEEIETIITFGGIDRQVDININTFCEDSAAAISKEAKEAIQEAINDIFNTPSWLLAILNSYPRTLSELTDYFTSLK